MDIITLFQTESERVDRTVTMERAKMRFELASEGEPCPNEQGLELRPGSGSELATKVDSQVRYLGVELEDALSIAESIDL